MATTGVGLSDEQVGQLREDLAAGKYPRVRVTAKHFGGASTGTVRKVGDPARDGEDFLTVRVTVNGVTDDLRFGPRELSRGPAAAVQASPARGTKPRAAKPAAGATTKTTAVRATARRTEPPRTPTAGTRTARPPKRGTSSASVQIVLTSSGTSWTVSAHRGARSVVKSAVVNPGVVSSIAALFDVPALEDAVAAVNDTARVEAEARAEQLRSELAEIQAVLDSHRRP
ncbi:MAG: hypothetical protein ABI345_08080 [Jatrophihabitans sp.]